ncbi:alpha/beta hydrolase [Actinokineospora iranica]|uniref:alpha/beta hydrolase n=1 Tax=Actinokineospora iranica TaxID=1271860 RepID=UPI00158734AF|nr:alpha/beta hydrolase-fold protein [Actinokineospora iranica]
MLLGGLGLGAGVAAGCKTTAAPGGGPENLLQSKAPTSQVQPVTTELYLSTGRYREVEAVIIRPAGVPVKPIPVCVALHGGIGGAKSFLDLGVPDILTGLVRDGVPPFAVVAVEGGNWVGGRNDDPQRMLNEDLPEWLDHHQLATTPFSTVGIGAGGTGALNLARTPGFTAVAVISPILFDSWADAAAAKMFTDRAHWERLDPLRHINEFAYLPVGVWCGTEDRAYLGNAKTLAQRVKAARTSFERGGHNDQYFRRALPDALQFVGGYL